MFTAVRTMLDRQAASFLEGDLYAVAEHYLFPCPFHTPTALVVLRSPREMVESLTSLHEECAGRGLVGIAPRIASVELVRRRRFRVWSRWQWSFDSHVEVPPEDSIYFLTLDVRGRPLIDMVECADHLVAAGDRFERSGALSASVA